MSDNDIEKMLMEEATVQYQPELKAMTILEQVDQNLEPAEAPPAHLR